MVRTVTSPTLFPYTTLFRSETAALRDFNPAHVAVGSGAPFSRFPRRVRFTPHSDHRADIPAPPLRDTTRLMHRRKLNPYSITSSAPASSVGGTSYVHSGWRH